MSNKQSNVSIIELLAENQVNLEWTPKCLWIRKTLPVMDVINPDLCIKFSDHGNDKTKVLIEGLRILGVEV